MKKFSTKVINLGAFLWEIPFELFGAPEGLDGCLFFIFFFSIWLGFRIIISIPFVIAGTFLIMYGIIWKIILLPFYIVDLVKFIKAKKQGLNYKEIVQAKEAEKERIKAEKKAQRKAERAALKFEKNKLNDVVEASYKEFSYSTSKLANNSNDLSLGTMDKLTAEKKKLEKSLELSEKKKAQLLKEYDEQIARLEKDAQKNAELNEKLRIAEEKRREKIAKLREEEERTKELIRIKKERIAKEKEAYSKPLKTNFIMNIVHIALVGFTLLIAFILYTASFMSTSALGKGLGFGLLGGILITAIMLVPTYVPLFFSSLSFIFSIKRTKLIGVLRIIAVFLYTIVNLISLFMFLVMILNGDYILASAFLVYMVMCTSIIVMLIVSLFTSLRQANKITKQLNEEENNSKENVEVNETVINEE